MHERNYVDDATHMVASISWTGYIHNIGKFQCRIIFILKTRNGAANACGKLLRYFRCAHATCSHIVFNMKSPIVSTTLTNIKTVTFLTEYRMQGVTRSHDGFNYESIVFALQSAFHYCRSKHCDCSSCRGAGKAICEMKKRVDFTILFM